MPYQPRWRFRLQALAESRWVGIVLTASWLVFAVLLERKIGPSNVGTVTPPGVAVATMGVIAALLSLRPKASTKEKANWMLLIGLLLVIEVQAIRRDRDDHDKAQADLLAQTMGGDGYPEFLAVFPNNKPSPSDLWPVKMMYFPKAAADKTPLIDVNVDILVRPSKGVRQGGFTREVLESLSNPAHYTLGNLAAASIFPAPFRLQSGKRYQIVITTRRGYFYENINIDPAPEVPGGYRESWCLYSHLDNKLLSGKCE